MNTGRLGGRHRVHGWDLKCSTAPRPSLVLAASCDWLALGGSCRSLTTHSICCVCQASGELSNLLCIWILSFCFVFFPLLLSVWDICVKESTTYQHEEPHRPGSPARLADWVNQTVKAAVLWCCKIIMASHGLLAAMRALSGSTGVGESCSRGGWTKLSVWWCLWSVPPDHAEPRHSAHVFSTKFMIPATGRCYAVCGILGSDLL